MADFQLRAIITAVDKLSPVLRSMSRQTRAWSRGFERAGRGAIPMAAGLGAAMLIPARAFMQAEDAATQLQNTLMTKDGLAGGFEELNKISVELGNRLPGTTADFLQMASTMKALGVSTDSLIGGSLQAAAYMAVVAKPLGVTYDQAAESIGKLGRAFGISGQEMTPFADTLQRALHMGGELEQMQYAMGRIAGPLKMLGKQGLSTANEMVPLVALLSQAGLQGEAIGTGIQTMIEALTAKGQYDGVKSLVGYLEQIHKLAPAKQLEVLNDLFGQHATKASIIGAGGYDQVVKDMQNQAGLQQRINNSLGTLTNLWDAATGTFTNAMVAFATAYAPQLKELAQSINDISTKLISWSSANAPAIQTALKLAAAFVGMKLAMYGIGIALAFVSRLMMMNPMGLFLQALTIAVPLIIAYSGDIKTAWYGAINFVTFKFIEFGAFATTSAKLIKDTFSTAAEFFKEVFGSAIDWVVGKFNAFVGVISNIGSSIGSMFSSLSLPNVGSMTLPGQSASATGLTGKERKPIVGNNNFKGSLDINHVGAPAGFRAAPVKSKGAPFKVNQNVGYNWSVTGM